MATVTGVKLTDIIVKLPMQRLQVTGVKLTDIIKLPM